MNDGRKRFSRIGLALFIMTVVVTGLQMGLEKVFGSPLSAAGEKSWAWYAMRTLPLYAVALPIAALLLMKIPDGKIEKKSLETDQLYKYLFVCFFLLGAGNLEGNAITALISFIAGRDVSNIMARLLGGSDIIASAVFVGIIAPVIEELFFRKLLIGKLSVYGDKIAILISALVFGLIHGNFSQFFYAFLIGLAFGYIYLKTGKITYTIAIHMIINLFGVFALFAQKLGLYAMTPLVLVEYGMMIAGLVIFVKKHKFIVLKKGDTELIKWGKTVFLNTRMILFFIVSAALFVLNTYSLIK